MMQKFIILITLTVFCLATFAQQERKPVRDGNALYQQKKYAEAEQKYDEALKLKPNLVEGIYNKANIQYQKKEYEEAAKQYETAAALSSDPAVKSKAYHNMGNAYLEAGKYKEGIDAYKNALKLNPADADTKYNLAYALQKMKQQQQQNQDQQNKDQNKENKDDKNQQQNKDEQKQDQQNKDQQQQNKQDQKGEDKKQQPNEQQQAEKNEEKKAEPRQAQISKADAEKLLDALKNEEQKVQLKLQKHKGEAKTGKVEKDW